MASEVELDEQPNKSGDDLAMTPRTSMANTYNNIRHDHPSSIVQYSPSWTPPSSGNFPLPEGAGEMDFQRDHDKTLPATDVSSSSELVQPIASAQRWNPIKANRRSYSDPPPSTTCGDPSQSSTRSSLSPQASNLESDTPQGLSIAQRVFDRSWIQPAIGLTTLLVTLIALFVYSHRTFVMAKWTEENDMLQACAQLIQPPDRNLRHISRRTWVNLMSEGTGREHAH
ncbi:MAG: hypothetical protein Q9219_004109 [cf. Caloplaca sp. 3 TL-2023]